MANGSRGGQDPIASASDTLEKLRRKGEFLVRHFGNPQGPLLTREGKSTLLALSAKEWGEPVPKNAAAAHHLAKKGEALLEKYHQGLKKLKPFE